jgi:hypothetical protein
MKPADTSGIKKGEYLKDGNNELARNSKNKATTNLYECKKFYQARNNLTKNENGDLLADPHNILSKWKNYISQLLNVHDVSDVGQTAEQLAPDPSP